MRIATRLLIAATLVLAVAGLGAAQNYSASLDGLQEVPPVPTPATGSATLTLDAAKMLHISMTYSGLVAPITASHVHGPAAPGVNAGVQLGIGALPSPINVIVGPLTAVQEANLNAGLFYLNIHTSFRPGGEIRGQILGVVGVDQSTWGAVKALYSK